MDTMTIVILVIAASSGLIVVGWILTDVIEAYFNGKVRLEEAKHQHEELPEETPE